MHVRSAFYMPYNNSYITQKKKKQKKTIRLHLRNIRTAAASETHQAAAAACVHQQMSERKVLCVSHARRVDVYFVVHVPPQIHTHTNIRYLLNATDRQPKRTLTQTVGCTHRAQSLSRRRLHNYRHIISCVSPRTARDVRSGRRRRRGRHRSLITAVVSYLAISVV